LDVVRPTRKRRSAFISGDPRIHVIPEGNASRGQHIQKEERSAREGTTAAGEGRRHGIRSGYQPGHEPRYRLTVPFGGIVPPLDRIGLPARTDERSPVPSYGVVEAARSLPHQPVHDPQLEYLLAYSSGVLHRQLSMTMLGSSGRDDPNIVMLNMPPGQVSRFPCRDSSTTSRVSRPRGRAAPRLTARQGERQWENVSGRTSVGVRGSARLSGLR
jgi:hypothetical protein